MSSVWRDIWAFVLLISTGVLMRSFGKLLDVRPGFDPQNVLTLRVQLPGAQYDKATKVAARRPTKVDPLIALRYE